MVLALLLSIFVIGFLCWLLFTLASLALPFFAAMTVGPWAYHMGAGIIGAILVAFAAGLATLIAGQLALLFVRSTIVRLIIVLLFTVPAVIAGYSAVYGLFGIGGSSEVWRQGFGVIGALLVGASAWFRLASGGATGQLAEPSAPSAG